MRRVISVQARMGSERLPGKVLADIGGTPLLAIMVERLRLSDLAEVVVATTELPEDDPIVALAGRLGVACVRGSTDDLLSRHLAAANFTQADVLGICGADDPLIDGRDFDRVFEAFTQPGTVYARTRGVPLGLDLYVIGRPELETAYEQATGIDRVEVVSWWEARFDRVVVESARDDPPLPDYRLTVDELPDLELHRLIFAALPWNATVAEVVALLDGHPEWAHMNAGVSQKFLW